MLKRFLESLDGLSDELKAFYKAVDGGFVLQVDGKDVEDVTALKNAKEHEKNLRVAAERARDEALTSVGSITTERDQAIAERDAAKGKQSQDVQALEHSWQEKLTEAQKTAKAKEDALHGEVERLLKTNTAQAMAAEISTVPELFSEVIAKRLKVEQGADNKYFVRVLDSEGNPSASSVDDLRKELLANDKYAAIIISGKGSGGGAGGSGSGGGASEKKWLEYSDTELTELLETDPDKYKRLRDAHRAGS